MRLLLILLLFFLTLNAQAQYLRTIRIGSYPNKKNTKTALTKLQNFIKTQPTLLQLQKKENFIFNYRKSGKYYIIFAAPFQDKKTLQTALNILRKVYPDIYVTKLKEADKKKIETIKKLQTQQPKHKSFIQKQHIAKQQQTQKQEQHIVKQQQHIAKQEQHITEQQQIQKQQQHIAKQQQNIKQYKQIQKISPKKKVFLSSWIVISIIICLLLLYLLYTTRKKITTLKNKIFITEEKLNQIKQKTTEKEQWITYITHELKAPLSSIVGLTKLLHSTPLSKSQIESLHKIKLSSKYMLSILDDLFDLSKLQTGNIILHTKEFNINDTIRYTYDIISQEALANNVSIQIKLNRNVPSKIISDPLRINQILINLLNHAVKFSKDSDVNLKIEKKDQFGSNITLGFTIEDNGLGMSEEEIQNVFNPYYQSQKIFITHPNNNNGFGLFITKHLVEALGGKITIQSKKGFGTTIYFEISVEIRDPQNKRQYRLPSKKLLHKTILIVDESNTTSLLLSDAFSYFKYNIEIIPSFEKNRKELPEKIDLAVIKIQSLSSLAVTKLKELQTKQHTKIIILDDLQTNLAKRPIKELLIDASLRPPITIQSIMDLIIELFMPKKESLSQEHPLKTKLKKFAEKKILVVEDNTLNHKIIIGMFKNTKIELSFAENGKEAIEMLQKGMQVDLILMDLNMPILDGYQTALEIRKNEKYNHIPIIALSASISQKTIQKVLEHGMQGHISKPINLEKFYQTIIKFLEKKKFSILLSDAHLIPDETENFSFEIGLKHCNNDKKMFQEILKDFMKMYHYAAYDIYQLCEKGDYTQARHLAMDLKDVALNIGAYKLGEITANLQYAIERRDTKSWKMYMKEFDQILKNFIHDIQDYLQKNQ